MPEKNSKSVEAVKQIRRQQTRTLEVLENFGHDVSLDEIEIIRAQEEKILARIDEIAAEENRRLPPPPQEKPDAF